MARWRDNQAAESPAWARIPPGRWPGGPDAWCKDACRWLDAHPDADPEWLGLYLSIPLPYEGGDDGGMA